MKTQNKFRKFLQRLSWEANMIMMGSQFRYKFDNRYRYLKFRPKTSDRNVIFDIFFREDYSLRSFKRYNDVQQRYNEIIKNGANPLILDAGANIGASSVWFASEYQNSKIVTIEPEYKNYELLKVNTSGLDIVNYNAAIGSEIGYVSISNEFNADPWAYQTKINSSGNIAVKTINDIVAIFEQNNCIPFIVKIDIEGFESELFEQNTEWMDKFYVIIIELHDWMLPASGSSKNFLNSISGKRRDFLHKGENIISIQY